MNWRKGVHMAIRLPKYDAAWLAVIDGQLPDHDLQSHGGEIPDDAIILFENEVFMNTSG